MRHHAVGAIAALFFCATLQAAEIVRDFDEANSDGWTFLRFIDDEGQIAFFDRLESEGGNPGGFVLHPGLTTGAPRLEPTAFDSPFLGDYRANQVTSLGVDLLVESSTTGGGKKRLHLVLMHDNETAAFMDVAEIPFVGEGWVSYNVVIESDSTVLPEGWSLINLNDISAPPIHTWNEIIQDVDRVQWRFGSPAGFTFGQSWILGADNARISMGSSSPDEETVDIGLCPGDADGSGQVEFSDITAVLGNWLADYGPSSGSGDADGDGTVGFGDITSVLANWQSSCE